LAASRIPHHRQHLHPFHMSWHTHKQPHLRAPSKYSLALRCGSFSITPTLFAPNTYNVNQLWRYSVSGKNRL
jgi:hypothetical protein